jgi:nudix-type nucleoside diphosphatase (YffH/AdpP family)
MSEASQPEFIWAESVYEGWLCVRVVTYRSAAGETVRREVEDHGSAACVLPYDPERRTALLVRLPRAPMILAGEPLSLEAPAGMLDDDEPEACARREAMEEVGVRLDRLEPIAAVWPMPGVSTERLHLFLAPYAGTDRTGQGGGVEGESEDITVVEQPLTDLAAAADAGRLQDAKTLLLLTTLRLRRPELFTVG